MQFFEDLGSSIERRWRHQNYDETVFPALAAEALAETPPNKHISPWEIIRWLYTTARIPNQQDISGAFGNPPITLYSGPRFLIDVYFWLDGTTNVHQHGFSGAFHVLLGSSLLSNYTFAQKRELNQHFLVGDITLDKVELLEQGMVRQILPGREYIHSLFHLDRPSATICVRTYQTMCGVPQFAYYKPCLAIDPFFKDPLAVKQLQSATLLLNMRHPDADSMIGELLSRSDFHTAFDLLDLTRTQLTLNHLEHTFGISTGEERFRALLEIARTRHGELIDDIIPVFDEGMRQRNLVRRRGQITSNEHRFFLALLLNVPNRVAILDLVKQRYPENDPVNTIVDWVEELANTKVAGSHEPNVLGIEGIDDDYLFVLQCLLEGRSIEETRRAFEEDISADQAAMNSDGRLENLWDGIRNSLLFRSMFLGSSVPAKASTSPAV
jgi:hypothetical protein